MVIIKKDVRLYPLSVYSITDWGETKKADSVIFKGAK